MLQQTIRKISGIWRHEEIRSDLTNPFLPSVLPPEEYMKEVGSLAYMSFQQANSVLWCCHCMLQFVTYSIRGCTEIKINDFCTMLQIDKNKCSKKQLVFVNTVTNSICYVVSFITSKISCNSKCFVKNCHSHRILRFCLFFGKKNLS